MNTTTLDDALLDGVFDHVDRIDVMKIDVEGFEPAVIMGGNRFFESKYAPRYVYMEMVSPLMDAAFGAISNGFADLSPESSYVNVFSTDLSLFDTLEIQYIIHWSIDKKLLRHEI
jgi:hypothetical protein